MSVRRKRASAFISGCLASLIVLAYPSQLLAQTNGNGPVQGVNSVNQQPPATPPELQDAVVSIHAGATNPSVLDPQPHPIREHTAFLVSLWETLLGSAYHRATSHLTAGPWVSGPTGMTTAQNEVGNSVAVDVALSLELLPAEFGYDQQTLDTLAAVSARFGVAWTTMSGNQSSDHILVWWFEWAGPNGVQTDIGPLTTIDHEDIDMIRTIVPLMDGFFDEPLNYNINDILMSPASSSAWSRFRSAVAAATVVLAVAVIVVGTGGLIVVAATAAAALAGAATTGAVGAVAVTAVTATLGTMVVKTFDYYAANAQAYNRLVQELQNAGHNLSGMTKAEILALAESLHR